MIKLRSMFFYFFSLQNIILLPKLSVIENILQKFRYKLSIQCLLMIKENIYNVKIYKTVI